jgi:hypothetical protein
MASQPYAIGLIRRPLPIQPLGISRFRGVRVFRLSPRCGILWGLRGEAGEQVRGDFILANLERVAVAVATGPASAVLSGDAHVGMAELAAYVAELAPRLWGPKRVRSVPMGPVFKG